MMAEPDEEGGEREVPDDLVEERGMERGVVLVPGGAVLGVDLEAPWQRGRAAEELLVEPVADPPDRLGDEQPRRNAVHEHRDVRAAPSKDPHAREHARGDAAPDPQAAAPDRERAPPLARPFVPARGEEVQPPPDQAGREPPQRAFLHERAVAAELLPAPRRDDHRAEDGEDVADAIGAEEQRADVEAVLGRAGEEGEERHPPHVPNRTRAAAPGPRGAEVRTDRCLNWREARGPPSAPSALRIVSRSDHDHRGVRTSPSGGLTYVRKDPRKGARALPMAARRLDDRCRC